VLDSPSRCIGELASINEEIAEFAAAWSYDSGLLKEKVIRYDRLLRAALLGIKGDFKVDEKKALAHAAVAQSEQGTGLAEEIEELEGKVEGMKTLFKTLERRSSIAQSILAAYRSEAKMGDFVVPDPQWSQAS
jgi:hypothetical protein